MNLYRLLKLRDGIVDVRCMNVSGEGASEQLPRRMMVPKVDRRSGMKEWTNVMSIFLSALFEDGGESRGTALLSHVPSFRFLDRESAHSVTLATDRVSTRRKRGEKHKPILHPTKELSMSARG